MVRFSFTESEGSRAEAALSPAGRCAKSAGESEAAIINYQLSTINAEGIASCSSTVGEAGADIKELRERSGNEEGLKFSFQFFNFSTFQFFNFSIFQLCQNRVYINALLVAPTSIATLSTSIATDSAVLKTRTAVA